MAKTKQTKVTAAETKLLAVNDVDTYVQLLSKSKFEPPKKRSISMKWLENHNGFSSLDLKRARERHYKRVQRA